MSRLAYRFGRAVASLRGPVQSRRRSANSARVGLGLSGKAEGERGWRTCLVSEPKSGTKWQVLEDFCATSPCSQPIRNRRFCRCRHEPRLPDRKLLIMRRLVRDGFRLFRPRPPRETSVSDRSGDRGKNGILCHCLIVAFRSRERIASEHGAITRRCRSPWESRRDRSGGTPADGKPGVKWGHWTFEARDPGCGHHMGLWPRSRFSARGPGWPACPRRAVRFGNVGIAHRNEPRPSETVGITHLQWLADQGVVQNGAFWR